MTNDENGFEGFYNPSVGTLAVNIEIGNLEGTRFEIVEALVDTGASYTRVPRPLLERLDVQPEERWPFRIADESVVEYDIGQAMVRLDGRARYVLAVFGPERSQALLGATTLETFGLGVDPVGGRLIRVPGLLL